MKMSWKKFSLHAGLLIVMAIITYIPVMKADFAVDDDIWVTRNISLRSSDGLKRIWVTMEAAPQYCPLVSTSFWVEYRLWGLKPFGYHLVNILLHALNAVLLWLILIRLSVPGAWLVAAIFLIHPLQVESLAWVSERKNILSALFYFASMLAYFRFSPPDENQPPRIHKWRYYFFSLFLFVCALLSKTVAFSMPAAILLVLWWKKDRIAWKDIYYLIPMFLLGVAATVIAMKTESYLYDLEGISRLHGGTESGGRAFSILERFLIAGRSAWFYVIKLLWPLNLTCFYARWKIDSGIWWQYLYPVGAIAVLVLLWAMRKKTGRGTLAAVLFYGGTLAPLSGFVEHAYLLYSFIADHFQYMACIGLIILGVSASALSLDRLGLKFRRVGCILSVAVILSLGALSWQQGSVYINKKTLYENNVRRSPGSAVAQYDLGYLLFQRGEVDKAIFYFKKALEIWPDHIEAHNNLGLALQTNDKLDEAMPHFYEAVRLNPANPKAQNNLGYALLQRGKFDEAIAHFYGALRINPNNEKAHTNLAYALSRQGKFDEAIAHYSAGLAINPQNANAHYNLGLLYLQKGDFEKAIREFKTALSINPNYVKASEMLKQAVEKEKAPSSPR